MKVTEYRFDALDRRALADLASRTCEPAGLALPELAIAALAQHQGARLLTVERDGRLLVAVPVIGNRAATSHLSNTGYPLLDREEGEAAFKALLTHRRRPLFLTGVPASGPLRKALQGAATRFRVMNQWQRAALAVQGTYVEWFNRNFDRKRRSRYRRHLTELSDLPGYRLEQLPDTAEAGSWVADFLALEASGWKGSRGTALQKSPAVAEVFRVAVPTLQEAGLLRFWRMTSSTGTIAMVMAIVERGQASFSKIAYNEDHARLSPGAMIILEATRALFAEGAVTMIDSCAIPDHPMLDNIWRDRLPVCNMMVAAENVSATTFALAVAASRLKTGIRSNLRDGLYWARGWKPS